MKVLFTATLVAGLACRLPAADPQPQPPNPFKTPVEKHSYAVGLMVGKQLKGMSADIDPEIYLKGLKDGLSGSKTTPFPEETQLREAVSAAQMEWRTKSLEKNKKEGEAFLAANKTKEGVMTTASGLQYKIETKGTGKLPGSNDTVSCHYRGSLIDGTEFDNSYKRGDPTSFAVTGVIKGWTEALLMMPVGSKWKLFIPSELAYGERGRPNIPPNSVLQFDIELVSIQDPASAPAPGAGAAARPAPGAAPKIQLQPTPPAKPK